MIFDMNRRSIKKDFQGIKTGIQKELKRLAKKLPDFYLVMIDKASLKGIPKLQDRYKRYAQLRRIYEYCKKKFGHNEEIFKTEFEKEINNYRAWIQKQIKDMEDAEGDLKVMVENAKKDFMEQQNNNNDEVHESEDSPKAE